MNHQPTPPAETHNDDGFGSDAAVFAEPKVTLDDLTPIADICIFEDVDTPDRLKAIIRHIRKLSGRHESSLLYEFIPTEIGGKRLIITFPEGDEEALVRALAKEVRREGVEDPAICDRLNKAHEQVKRARAVVEAIEQCAASAGALAGDVIDAIKNIRTAHANGEETMAFDMIEQLAAQLKLEKHKPFVKFAMDCRAIRDANKVDVVVVDEGGGSDKHF